MTDLRVVFAVHTADERVIRSCRNLIEPVWAELVCWVEVVPAGGLRVTQVTVARHQCLRWL